MTKLDAEHKADVRQSCASLRYRWTSRKDTFAPMGPLVEQCVSEGVTHGPSDPISAILVAPVRVAQELKAPREDEGMRHVLGRTVSLALSRLSYAPPPKEP
ncbi:MAG: hypothetical protein ACT4TC_02060 [Myxococcaceae bacterium]